MIYARHVSNSFGGNIFEPDNECVGKSPLKYYLEKKEITREKNKKNELRHRLGGLHNDINELYLENCFGFMPCSL